MCSFQKLIKDDGLGSQSQAQGVEADKLLTPWTPGVLTCCLSVSGILAQGNPATPTPVVGSTDEVAAGRLGEVKKLLVRRL